MSAHISLACMPPPPALDECNRELTARVQMQCVHMQHREHGTLQVNRNLNIFYIAVDGNLLSISQLLVFSSSSFSSSSSSLLTVFSLFLCVAFSLSFSLPYVVTRLYLNFGIDSESLCLLFKITYKCNLFASSLNFTFLW